MEVSGKWVKMLHGFTKGTLYLISPVYLKKITIDYVK